jgi:hypothetical protein
MMSKAMLSPAQFAELLSLIQMTRDEGTRSEVRRAPRVEHPCRITVTMDADKGGSAGILVQLKDISARGMCFLHNQMLTPGAAMVATLEAPGKTVSVRANVVHCKQLDPHTYQVGAEFTPVADPPEPLEFERTAEDWMQTRPKAFAGVVSTKKSF